MFAPAHLQIIRVVSEASNLISGAALQSLVIVTRELEERHTGAHLGDVLTDILANWDLSDDKVVAVVTNNGSNITAAINKHSTRKGQAHTVLW